MKYDLGDRYVFNNISPLSRNPTVYGQIGNTRFNCVSFAIWLIRRTFIRDRKPHKKCWTTRKNTGGCRLQNRWGPSDARRARSLCHERINEACHAARRFAWTKRSSRKKVDFAVVFFLQIPWGSTRGAIYRCFLRRERFTRPLPFHS